MQLTFIAGSAPCTFEGITFEILVAALNSDIASVLPAVAQKMTETFPQGEGLSFSAEDIQNFLDAAAKMPAQLTTAEEVNGKQFADLCLIAAEREVNPEFKAFSDEVSADNYVALMEQTLLYLAEPEAASTETTTTTETAVETEEMEFTTTEIVSEEGTTTEMVAISSTMVEDQARLLSTMKNLLKSVLGVQNGINQTNEALLNALKANHEAAASSNRMLENMGDLLEVGGRFLPTNVQQAAEKMIEAGEAA